MCPEAATALKHKGIRLVIAGSFSETYKRNALNNGYLIIDLPELADDLKAKYRKDQLTVNTQEEIVLKATKEIIVKFIETGRLSTSSFEEAYLLVNRVVRENIRSKPRKEADRGKKAPTPSTRS